MKDQNRQSLGAIHIASQSDQIKADMKSQIAFSQIIIAAGTDMSRKADIIVTEIFDSELLGEGNPYHNEACKV